MQNKTNPVVFQETEKKRDSLLGLFVRLYWMILAYIPVVIAARYILKNNTKSFSKWDILYWSAFICLITLRYIDVKFLNGETAEGKPATTKNVKIFSIVVFFILLIGYLVIKIFPLL